MIDARSWMGSWWLSNIQPLISSLYRLASVVPVYSSALHHEADPAHRGDIGRGIAVGRDDVRLHPRRNRADRAAKPQRLGAHRRRRDDRVHWRLAGVVHAADEIFGVAAMRTRSEEHTSELQSRQYLVCRLLLEKKKNK